MTKKQILRKIDICLYHGYHEEARFLLEKLRGKIGIFLYHGDHEEARFLLEKLRVIDD